MVTIRLEGSKEMQAALREMSDDVRQGVSKAVIGTAMELEKDVKTSIKKPGTGRLYSRRGVKHRASAPGKPPATDTGRLLNSIKFDKIGDLTATVGSNIVYSLHLEYGTVKMAARPFFRPAVERMRPKFQTRLEKALGMATR